MGHPFRNPQDILDLESKMPLDMALDSSTVYQRLCKTRDLYPDRPAVSFQLKSDAHQVDIEVGRQHGLVKWVNPTKGFGFIEQDNGQDLFVHQSEIRLSGFRYLNKDDRVEYDIGLGKKGPVAQNVVRIKAADNEWDQVPEEEQISKAS